MDQDTLYLDNAASTPVLESVIDTYCHLSRAHVANSSSGHRPGQEAKGALENLRHRLGALTGVAPEGVIFTSGATESNNTVLRQFERGRILVGATEHSSVFKTARALEDRGATVEVVPVSRSGVIDLFALEELLGGPAALVSVMTVNNETGLRNPVEEISAMVKSLQPEACFHTDTAQSVSKDIWPQELKNIDFMTLSAHKFHGPKGVGALLSPTGRPLHALLTGGGQERGQRSGTSALPLAGAMVQALEETLLGRDENFAARCQWFFEELIRLAPELSMVGQAPRAPWIANLSFRGLRGDAFARALENEGIIVSTGSACAGQKGGLSRVLKSMKGDSQKGHIRLSLNHLQSQELLKQAAKRVASTYDTYALL